MGPKDSTATVRMEWLIVSPMPNAVAMMMELSMMPTMMRAVWPGRRGMLRRPSFTITGLRHASTATTPRALPVMARSTHMRVVMETPKSSSTGCSASSGWGL